MTFGGYRLPLAYSLSLFILWMVHVVRVTADNLGNQCHMVIFGVLKDYRRQSSATRIE